MELFIIFGVPGAIAAYVIYTRHRERMEAIKRGVHTFRIPDAPQTGNKALALGLLVTGIGLALILAGIGILERVDHDMITSGFILAFGGGALLLYWRITAQDRKKARQLYEKRLEIYLSDLPKHTRAGTGESDRTGTDAGVQDGEA